MPKGKNAKRYDIRPDELVARLVDDPSDIPETKLYAGWLGKSQSNKKWRLYLSPTLDNYLEIDLDDILHQMQVDQSPLGGSFVWVDRDAKVTHTRTTAAQSQADFLSGSITAALFSPSAGRLPIGIPTQPVAHWTLILIPFLGFALAMVGFATLDRIDSKGQCPTNLSHCC